MKGCATVTYIYMRLTCFSKFLFLPYARRPQFQIPQLYRSTILKVRRFKKQRRYREWKGAVELLENLLRISGRACELEELEKKYDDWFKEYKHDGVRRHRERKAKGEPIRKQTPRAKLVVHEASDPPPPPPDPSRKRKRRPLVPSPASKYVLLTHEHVPKVPLFHERYIVPRRSLPSLHCLEA